jgi:hypothetical protein
VVWAVICLAAGLQRRLRHRTIFRCADCRLAWGAFRSIRIHPWDRSDE